MCGITGIVSGRNVGPELFAGMQTLEYRGYDSAGMGMLEDGHLHVRKGPGKIIEVDREQGLSSMTGTVGIAHTRWATHGGVTQANSHPHTSGDNCFAVVHNGVIENYLALRAELMTLRYTFRSRTDTEVIAHLLAVNYALTHDVEAALRATAKRLEGTSAFVFLTTHAPQQLFCVRSGSPLVIGIGSDATYVASDPNAFLAYTQQAVYLKDGEYAVLDAHDYAVKSLASGGQIFRGPEMLSLDMRQSTDKGAYPHYMLKEIHDGASVVEAALAIPREQIRKVASRILESKNIFLTGIGSTFYAALIAQSYFADLADLYVPVISADEFPSIARLHDGDLTIALSQSGETHDTLKALRYTKSRGGQTVAIVNAPGSTMTREVDQVILQGAGSEICVLSTKSLVSQVTILLRIALEVGWRCRKISETVYDEHYASLQALPETLRQMYCTVMPEARRIGETYCHTLNWFFIGRGIYSGVAIESALKFKEGAYLHAEGTPGGFLKHGTIALIDENFHTVAFLPPASQHDLFTSTLINVQEIRARNGLVIGFHHQKDDGLIDSLDDALVLPNVPWTIAPLVQLTAGQMLAYYTALSLGRNIDKPRSLAKSVTVA